jgi:hypothetical protein
MYNALDPKTWFVVAEVYVCFWVVQMDRCMGLCKG